MALSGESTSEIDAPIDAVWALIDEVRDAPEWQDGLLEMREIEADADGRLVVGEFVNDAKVRKLVSRVRFTRAAPHRLSWVQEKGDVKSVAGSWTLEDLGDGRTRATYAIEVDFGRILGRLITGPLEAAVRPMLVGGRANELKRLAERG